MHRFRSKSEQIAWEQLVTSAELGEQLSDSGSEVRVLRGDCKALFVGGIRHHILRSYRNGMARMFHGLASSAMANYSAKAGVHLSVDSETIAFSGVGYSELCHRAALVQRAWPLGVEMRQLLNSYCLQGVRGRMLSIPMSRMAIRLGASFQRRLCLAHALHLNGMYAEADQQMAQILSRVSNPMEAAQAWDAQAHFCLERGRVDHAMASSRAAVACAGHEPFSLLSWLLSSALAGDRSNVQDAGRLLGEVAGSEHVQVRRFRKFYAGRYSQVKLPGHVLNGLPKVAQQVLWEAFTGGLEGAV